LPSLGLKKGIIKNIILPFETCLKPMSNPAILSMEIEDEYPMQIDGLSSGGEKILPMQPSDGGHLR
jgi:hypothetical protein